MALFRHILVPVDFGEPSARALDLAVEMAVRFDTKLTLFHASAMPAYYYAAYGEGMTFPLGELEARAKMMLGDLVAKTKPRYPLAESFTSVGVPWEEILAVTTTLGADLIVMGTHGRRGVARVFLGSVAEKVVRHALVPVLTTAGTPAQERLPVEAGHRDRT